MEKVEGSYVRRNIPKELERRVYGFSGFPLRPDSIKISPLLTYKGKEENTKSNNFFFKYCSLY